MIPLTLLNIGESGEIQKISGNDSARRHLAEIGFVVGENVEVVCKIEENLILSIKGSRIALNRDIAQKIMVYGGMKNENTQECRRRRHRHGRQASR